MNLGLKGKRALVMGSSSGLGKGVAKCLIEEGAHVAICARTEMTLLHAAKEINAAFSWVVDLSKEGASTQLVEKVLTQLGGIDILVINSGGPPKGGFHEVSIEQWKQGFRSLWLSAVEAIQVALPPMKNQGFGRILLITSVAAKEPLPALTLSNGLRAGLLGLVKSLSFEVAPHGITVNALLPGYTDTERLKELGVPHEKMLSGIPAGRLGKTEEFGALAAFLSSSLAGYITGQAIAADGGALRGI
jgi:3-oxoacyl-[acyl-carrier protein] reductase